MPINGVVVNMERQTLILSKTLEAYWKYEEEGPTLRDPYGLICGEDHPRSWRKSMHNICLVV